MPQYVKLFWCEIVIFRAALTECNVLSDVLHMAKEKHYMTLHAVQAESHQEKYPGIQMFAKKRVRPTQLRIHPPCFTILC